MDYDPDGMAILWTYKYGSFSLVDKDPMLTAPCMQWLGIRSSVLVSRIGSFAEITNDSGSQESGNDGSVHRTQGLLRLTPRDRRKAIKMLERDGLAGDGLEAEWRRELQVMLLLNVKAEIQILEATAEGLAGWLQTKLECVTGQQA